ncbi:hypothetical protein AtubIFM56815_008473 [Aspergillus tubingensis]|nr:hypothetical protein AtubIFM54640_007052 [Aspergillus tubingensis]GLA84262.1 hypothetical protein AtubIFM56815_008473 [Aspergillus tubingensis]
MRELLRDTAFGKIVRLLSGRRLLLYTEERDRSFIQEMVATAAEVGVALPELIPNESIVEPNGLETIMSQASYRSRQESWPIPAPRDEKAIIVGWRSGDSENWSFAKKLLVSSLVWVLTFAIYIGSAIYSPGIPGAAKQFGVSNVAATLGLTLFVLGYGVG